MGLEHAPEFLHCRRIGPHQARRLLVQLDWLPAAPADRLRRPGRFRGSDGNRDRRSFHVLTPTPAEIALSRCRTRRRADFQPGFELQLLEESEGILKAWAELAPEYATLHAIATDALSQLRNMLIVELRETR
jgi:hypothetical protein